MGTWARYEKREGGDKNYPQGCLGKLNNVYLEKKCQKAHALAYNVKTTHVVPVIVASTKLQF